MMDLPPHLRGLIEALTAQRNREADAVAELNGRIAAREAEIHALRQRVQALEAALFADEGRSAAALRDDRPVQPGSCSDDRAAQLRSYTDPQPEAGDG